jgi:hypothetical protein
VTTCILLDTRLSEHTLLLIHALHAHTLYCHKHILLQQNGGHSALSYTGFLCGYTYVDDAMADPVISGFISALFSEVCPTLMPVPGVDTPSYCAKLIERFSKSELLILAYTCLLCYYALL